MPEITIHENEAGKRIDVVLAGQLEISRSLIQKLIKSGDITLDKQTIKPNVLLELGGVIFYPEAEVYTPAPKTGPAPVLEIVFQDDDLMIINKPSGLLVHQATPHDVDPTVVDAILEMHPSIAEVGDDPARPGIVHRLDKDVSGLMIITKTQEAFDFIKKQFQDRTIEKFYLALVYGGLPKDEDVIELKIARSKARGRMVARTGEQEGKESRTEYYVLEWLKTTTYVRVQIHTGRTHQIRVHFHAIGHALVGDKLYKIKKMRHHPIKLDRIFLHATKLSFTLPNGERKTFDSPLPDELEMLLRQLRSV